MKNASPDAKGITQRNSAGALSEIKRISDLKAVLNWVQASGNVMALYNLFPKSGFSHYTRIYLPQSQEEQRLLS